MAADVLDTLSVKKTLGPWGYGLAGYDSDGELALVLPCKPRNGVKWFHRNVTSADRKRVQEAYEDIYGEDDDE